MNRAYADVLREALECVAQRRAWELRGAPEAAHRATVDGRLLHFVIASLPAVLVGLWSHSAALTEAGVADRILNSLGSFAPLLVVALGVCLLWEVVFARLLQRPADAGWLMTAWLFAALTPPWTPPLIAAFGLSVGVIFGCHIFGGTGRYLVSPALLGAVFVSISYPYLFTEEHWRENVAAVPAWLSIAEGGVGELTQSATSWLGVFAGAEVGVIGVPSAMLCLLGAAFLGARGVASWRTIAGGILGLVLVSSLLNALGSEETLVPWYWHLATGSFAFGLAFIATDPTTLPLTKAARWMHGLLIGGLVVLLRTSVPARPEATLTVLLFASLCIPLLDHVVVAVRKRAIGRRARI